MSALTPKPTGSDAESIFHQETYESVQGSRGQFNDSSTVKVKKGPRGISWHARPQRGGAPSTPSTAQDFTIISIQADYITAKNNKTNAIEKVAKNFKLRCSIVSSSVDGAAWTYSYSSTTARRAAQLNYVEFQRVSPRYLVNDIIYADKPESTGVAGVDWLDQNRDGRVWSAKVDQTTP